MKIDEAQGIRLLVPGKHGSGSKGTLNTCKQFKFPWQFSPCHPIYIHTQSYVMESMSLTTDLLGKYIGKCMWGLEGAKNNVHLPHWGLEATER